MQHEGLLDRVPLHAAGPRVPFQCRISDVDVPGFGLFWRFHSVPFHRRISPRVSAPYTVPTAQEFEADVASTSRSRLSAVVPTVGLGCTAQDEPFHRSINVAYRVPSKVLPTAHTRQEDNATMPSSELSPAPTFGVT